MPLYTLKCKNCNHTGEALCTSPEKVKNMKCEKCKKKGLERIFGAFSIKGSSGSVKTRSSCNSSSCKAAS
ncbi:MAG: zinc ribbon domain-containing protein [Planctomycetota bacterium]